MGSLVLTADQVEGEKRPSTWQKWKEKLFGGPINEKPKGEAGLKEKHDAGVIAGTKQILDGVKDIANGVTGIYIGDSYFKCVRGILRSFCATLSILAILTGVIMLTIWIGQVSPWLESIPEALSDGINSWLYNVTVDGKTSVGSVSAACIVNPAGGCIPTQIDEQILQINLRALNIDV